MNSYKTGNEIMTTNPSGNSCDIPINPKIMNTIFQTGKILIISFFLTSLLCSCTKEEPIEYIPTVVLCDHVTINITNNLDKDIENFEVDEVNIGTLKAGETYNELCLDKITSDSGIYPYLVLTGLYQGIETGGTLYVCGMGLQQTETGVFDISVNSVEQDFFFYSAE